MVGVARRRQSGTATSTLRVPPPRPIDVVTHNHGVIALQHLLPPPVVWVLAGGGSHGAVQLGSLQAVSETDLRPDRLIGSSAGALTGAVIAEDPVAAVNRLAYLWSTIDLTDIVAGGWTSLVSPANLTKPSLSDSTGELASLEEVYDARDFADLVLPFSAVATDLVTGQPTLLNTGELLPALLASSAIPGVLPPVKINDRWYIDALASANLPASVAMRQGAGSIVVFDTGSSAQRPAGTSLTQLMSAINSLLATTQRLSSLTQAAATVPVIYLPTPGGLAGTMSFKDSMGTAREAYLLARSFLIDLSRARGDQGPLAPGLYARSDALVAPAGNLAVARVLRAVASREIAGNPEAPADEPQRSEVSS